MKKLSKLLPMILAVLFAAQQIQPALAASGTSQETGSEDTQISQPVSNDDSVRVRVNGKGTLQAVKEGEKVTVNLGPAEGYYLAQVRYSYTENGKTVWKQIPRQADIYSCEFSMPADTVTVYADYISVQWDGTVDLTWYDPEADTYELDYAAQLAGAAALCNGLFNDYPTAASTDSSGKAIQVPDVDAEGHSKCADGSNYYTMKDIDGDGIATVVVGDLSQVTVKKKKASSGTYNVTTTNEFWEGQEHFTGKTVRIGADMDLGGTWTDTYTGNASASDPTAAKVSGKLTEKNWSGPNYMPIGGQYCMDKANGYTRLGSYFNGTFNGQGHIIYNLYLNRHVDTGEFGNCQGIGLIGALGTLDANKIDLAKPVVENIAVDGMIYGNRMNGGIVGHNCYSTLSTVKNCVNFASIHNTDAKGNGGIVGAGYENLSVQNCVNYGFIYTGYNKNAGGIIGLSEGEAKNCYTMGYIWGETTNGTNREAAQSLGTNNGGALWTNCYYLAGSSSAVKNPAVYGGTTGSTIYEKAGTDVFRSADFLKSLNGTTRAFVASSANTDMFSVNFIRALQQVHSIGATLEALDASGTPVPRVFLRNDTSHVTGFSVEGTPETSYVEGQKFDAGSYKIWANYDDGTREEVTDYTVTYASADGTENTGAFQITDDSQETETQSVMLNGTVGDKTFQFAVSELTVAKKYVEKIQIIRRPDNLLYADGETFDPAGIVVQAVYTNGKKEKIPAYEEGTGYGYTLSKNKGDRLSAADTSVTVSFTYRSRTAEASVPIHVLDTEAPEVIENEEKKTSTAVIASENDLIWFNNQVTTGKNTKLMAELETDLTLTSDWWRPTGLNADGDIQNPYEGTFDGKNHTITVNITEQKSVDYNASALFAALGTTGVVKNLTAAGSIEGNAHTAGIAGSVDGGKIINCVNRASISGSSYAGGIAGELGNAASVLCCINQGTVTAASEYAGGIAGCCDGDGITAASCLNLADASVTGGTSAGGIAGSFQSGNGKILQCENQARISGTETADTSNYHGGIAGTVSAKAVIESCSNTGSVTAEGGSIGGIAGQLQAEGAVISCMNSAEVSNHTSGTSQGAGGIVGLMYGKKAEIRDSYNAGKVGFSVSSGKYCGAVVGKTADLSMVENNYALTGTAAALIVATVSSEAAAENAAFTSTPADPDLLAGIRTEGNQPEAMTAAAAAALEEKAAGIRNYVEQLKQERLKQAEEAANSGKGQEQPVQTQLKAPAAPGGLKAVSSSYSSLKLTWKRSAGASGYEICQKVGSRFKKIKTVSGTSLTVKNLKTGTKYQFRIRAYLRKDQRTAYGKYTATVSAVPALKKVSGVKGKRKGKTTVRVSWKKTAGASGYQILRSVKKSKGYKTVGKVTSGKKVVFTDKKAKKGKKYYYRVRAYRKVSGKTVKGPLSSVRTVK
jgi:hypothetical protein